MNNDKTKKIDIEDIKIVGTTVQSLEPKKQKNNKILYIILIIINLCLIIYSGYGLYKLLYKKDPIKNQEENQEKNQEEPIVDYSEKNDCFGEKIGILAPSEDKNGKYFTEGLVEENGNYYAIDDAGKKFVITTIKDKIKTSAFFEGESGIGYYVVITEDGSVYINSCSTYGACDDKYSYDTFIKVTTNIKFTDMGALNAYYYGGLRILVLYNEANVNDLYTIDNIEFEDSYYQISVDELKLKKVNYSYNDILMDVVYFDDSYTDGYIMKITKSLYLNDKTPVVDSNKKEIKVKQIYKQLDLSKDNEAAKAVFGITYSNKIIILTNHDEIKDGVIYAKNYTEKIIKEITFVNNEGTKIGNQNGVFIDFLPEVELDINKPTTNMKVEYTDGTYEIITDIVIPSDCAIG